MVTPNVETSISAVISDGKGDNLFFGIKRPEHDDGKNKIQLLTGIKR